MGTLIYLVEFAVLTRLIFLIQANEVDLDELKKLSTDYVVTNELTTKGLGRIAYAHTIFTYLKYNSAILFYSPSNISGQTGFYFT